MSQVVTGNKILIEIWYEQQKLSASLVYENTEVASAKHNGTQMSE